MCLKMPWVDCAFVDLGRSETDAEWLYGLCRRARMSGLVNMLKKNPHIPWCAVAVAAWLRDAHCANVPMTDSALTFADYGQALFKPEYNCIAVFKRPGGGHVGFVLAADSKQITLIGGNQGDRVSIAKFAREGKEWSFRWPPGMDVVHQGMPSTISGSDRDVSVT